MLSTSQNAGYHVRVAINPTYQAGSAQGRTLPKALGMFSRSAGNRVKLENGDGSGSFEEKEPD